MDQNQPYGAVALGLWLKFKTKTIFILFFLMNTFYKSLYIYDVINVKMMHVHYKKVHLYRNFINQYNIFFYEQG